MKYTVFHIFSGSKNALACNSGGVETFLNNMLNHNSEESICSIVIGRKILFIPQIIRSVKCNGACIAGLTKASSKRVNFPFIAYLLSNVLFGIATSFLLIFRVFGCQERVRVRTETNQTVFHAHDPVVGASLFLLSKKLLPRTTFVSHFHSEYSNRLQIMLPPTLLSQVTINLCRFMERLCAEKSDKIIAVNKNIRNYLISLGCSQPKILTIPVFLDIEKRVESGKINKVQNLAVDKGQFLVTYIGRLTKEKNVPLIISAFLSLDPSIQKNLKLLIVGAGYQSALLKSMAANSKNILFLGHRTDIDSLLDITDVFVLPSFTEGFPFSLLEAMSHGKPIIASNISPIAEIVRNDHEAILIDPNDFLQLSIGLLRLYRDPELRLKLGLNAKAKAKKYDLKVIFPKFIECYNK